MKEIVRPPTGQRVRRPAIVPQISSIGRGICVLVGLGREDGDEDIDYVVRKLLNLRLFDNPDTHKRWDKSVSELGLEVLCVSQFTLHACIKGNKLDFHRAMGAEEASQQFYARFLDRLRTAYEPGQVKDGAFGALMSVQLENDGPVTISVDSREQAEG